jgi:hypothetical protein
MNPIFVGLGILLAAIGFGLFDEKPKAPPKPADPPPPPAPPSPKPAVPPAEGEAPKP